LEIFKHVVLELWAKGYSAADLIVAMRHVCKSGTNEKKLDFLKEIGSTYLRITEGLGTLLQLEGLIGRLSLLKISPQDSSTNTL
jgi:replication factor C subunit 2/4